MAQLCARAAKIMRSEPRKTEFLRVLFHHVPDHPLRTPSPQQGNEAPTNPTRRISNETQHHVNHRVSALDPLADASHYGRHRPWDIEGRELKHCVGRSRGP